MHIGLTILMLIVVVTGCGFLGYVGGHLRGYLVGRSEACRTEPPNECIDKEILACRGEPNSTANYHDLLHKAYFERK